MKKSGLSIKNKEKNFEKISYEEIGLFPRSFSRVFDRFVKQLFNDVENLVLQEYRFYRYLFLTTVKCLFILLLVPFLVNLLAKNYLVRPLTEYLWNTKQSEIFLNAYQQKHAFSELKYFEEKLYFESLVSPSPKRLLPIDPAVLTSIVTKQPLDQDKGLPTPNLFLSKLGNRVIPASPKKSESEEPDSSQEYDSRFLLTAHESPNSLAVSSSSSSSSEEGDGRLAGVLREKRISSPSYTGLVSNNKELSSRLPSSKKKNRISALQLKTVELAITYNNQSIEAITNFFADLMSVITFLFLLVAMEIPINISKSFLLEVFFGLDDSKKSLLILLVTDLLVGYHSDGPWAIFFESLFNHYGLPESQTGIFLLVATLPVLLDVLFKYLIFRHLNRASPATVATYHAMIE